MRAYNAIVIGHFEIGIMHPAGGKASVKISSHSQDQDELELDIDDIQNIQNFLKKATKALEGNSNG